MTVLADPEGVSAAVLKEFTDFKDKRVFEIGCGNGRITWGYAEQTSHVTAIDPIAEDIQKAKSKIPDSLKAKLVFIESNIEDFNLKEDSGKFDISLFTWSL